MSEPFFEQADAARNRYVGFLQRAIEKWGTQAV